MGVPDMKEYSVQEAEAVLDRATKDIWLEQPEDIRRMLRRNVEIEKNFSVWVSCNGRIDNFNAILYSWYTQMERGDGDVRFWQSLLSFEMDRYSQLMRNQYDMVDAAHILEVCARGYAGAETMDQLLALTRSALFYVAQLAYWVDMSIPWDKISTAFSQIMREQG